MCEQMEAYAEIMGTTNVPASCGGHRNYLLQSPMYIGPEIAVGRPAELSILHFAIRNPPSNLQRIPRAIFGKRSCVEKPDRSCLYRFVVHH